MFYHLLLKHTKIPINNSDRAFDIGFTYEVLFKNVEDQWLNKVRRFIKNIVNILNFVAQTTVVAVFSAERLQDCVRLTDLFAVDADPNW